MIFMAAQSFSVKSQSGIVLVVSLIMLLLLTIVSLTGMQNTGLEEKMAGNMRDTNLAFQAAESALLAGELAAAAKPAIVCPGGNPVGFYTDLTLDCAGVTKSPAFDWAKFNWATSSMEYPGNKGVLGKLSANPRYVVEVLPNTVCRDSSGKPIDTHITLPPGCNSPNKTYRVYRVTSKATGGTDSAVVALQTIYEISI
jgi:type IV pilus assembly protein PilX